MFNDLNQPNQPTAGTPPVDDIFADTDKSAEAKNFSGYYANTATTPVASSLGTPTEIDTQKAGLSASEELPVSSKGKILKVILIALLIILLIGLGYLIYIKFLTGQNDQELTPVETVISTTTKATITPPVVTQQATTSIPVSEEVVVSTTTPLATTTPPVANLEDTDGDGLTNVEENVLGTDINLKDTDGDGLSDYDEVKIYNTNPKLVDSDSDGLSDYEEINIYKTDPIKADTDGDGHNDGEEVKNGYNPLGAGKMTDLKK
jgi:Bacterial TSP3 repeat